MCVCVSECVCVCVCVDYVDSHLLPFLTPNTIHTGLTQVVDDQLLTAIHQRFRELDTDGSGRLTREDFMQLVNSTREAPGEGVGVSRVASASSFASAADLEGGAGVGGD